MSIKQKKIVMLIVGFLVHATAFMLKCLHISDSRTVILFLSLMQYAGMLSYIFAGNYFVTTYQYEKYPEENRQTLIDRNDERTKSIHNLAKARVFDIMVYVLIFLPFLLVDLKADLAGIIGSGIALLIFGCSYAFYLSKYSKEM